MNFITLVLWLTTLFVSSPFSLPAQGGAHSGVGGGASVMCAAVVQANLQACYDSGSGLTCTSGCSNGNAVTQWNDQSGNANNLTCSTCPIYESAQINSNPSIRFNGSSQYFSFGTAVNLQTASSIFVVFKGTAADGCWVCGTSAGSIGYVYGHSTAAQAFYITTLQDNGNATADSSWHQANYTYDATTLTFRINESADNTPTPLTTAVTANETTVGYYPEYSIDFYTGDIAAIIIYNTLLSSPNVATNEAVLNAKYGI